MAKQMPDIGEYKYGFRDEHKAVFQTGKGLSADIVRAISEMKASRIGCSSSA